jgi:hypothetical protein
MEVPDGWASDESEVSEVSEVSDGGRGSGFFLDHPGDHPGALTETAFALAAGRASLAGATEVEIAFDAFERVHPDALRACAGSLTHLGLMHNGLRAFPALRHVSSTLRKLELTHQSLGSMMGLADAGAMPALRELLLNDNAIARIEGLGRVSQPRAPVAVFQQHNTSRGTGRARVASRALAAGQRRGVRRRRRRRRRRRMGRVEYGNGGKKRTRDAFAGFAPLLRVRELKLAGNRRLVDLETCLAAVACLPTLESLSFRDEHFAQSPVAAQPEYRARAARRLRQLRVLDAAEVTVAERGAAADERVRARCLDDAEAGREREAHETKVAELEKARDRRVAAAAAARARAQAALRAVEKATMLGPRDSPRARGRGGTPPRGSPLGPARDAAAHRRVARARLERHPGARRGGGAKGKRALRARAPPRRIQTRRGARVRVALSRERSCVFRVERDTKK